MSGVRIALIVVACVVGAGGDVVVFPFDGPGLIEDEFVDEPSVFGDNLPLEGLRGLLVTGFPKDGCKPLARPPTVDNFVGKWIVLLARYNCSFEEKVRNAESAGYDAAIVHNVNSTDLERMSAKNAVGITIPSVFVSNETGYDLENSYTYQKEYFIVMNREVPFDINTHLLLPFAVVVGLCLIIMIIFMIVKCIKDRRRAQRHRLPNKALKKIPTCRYSKGDPYDTCAICLDDYLEGDKLRVLPCAHAYHCKCIDPWLTKNRRVCPVCKRRVFAAGERRARSRRLSDTDTDSDDSSAPLVASRDTPTTQGGTFAPQRENPFSAAERFVARLRREREQRQTRRSRAREISRANLPTAESRQNDGTTTTDPSHGTGEGTEPVTVAGGSGAVVPFLSGVLNLRHNHFGRGEAAGTDTEPLIASQSSLPAQSSEELESRRNRRRRRPSEPRQPNATRPSINTAQPNTTTGDSSRGEIGVAALPNTYTNERYIV